MQTPDHLLTEVERQQKYLDALPDNFQFPLFNAKTALESMRASAYHDSARAAREIVDNAIEAGATRIDIVLRPTQGRKGPRVVDAVAFIDNGSGMLPEMARYALSWGGGTHINDSTFIGRFGFGLPNSSINQTRLTHVFTRTMPSESFTRVTLDLDQVSDWGAQRVPPGVSSELPDWILDYLERNGLDLPHGTVVIWEHPDRVSPKSVGKLKEQFLDDFGVTYRYLLLGSSPLDLIVEGKRVEPLDPLFLTPEGRDYLAPIDDVEAAEGGGARKIHDVAIPVRYGFDPETNERQLSHLTSLAEVDEDDPHLLALGTIYIAVARLPYGFTRDDGSSQSVANRRFRVRKRRRGMSFVRSNREIVTLDAFPKDRAPDGLGKWPLLQSYAYHWGVEVRFSPELDGVFGITNDKQGVRPIEDFWRVLTAVGVDDWARRENNWQTKVRSEKNKEKLAAKARAQQETATPSLAEVAAREADIIDSEPRRIPEHAKESARDAVDQHIRERAAQTGEDIERVREAIRKEISAQPYRVDFASIPDGPFYEPKWLGDQIVLEINEAHPFFQVVYRRLVEGDSPIAKDGVDLLLFALARGELKAESEEMRHSYEVQRKRRWSRFLEDSIHSLERRAAAEVGPRAEEEQERLLAS